MDDREHLIALLNSRSASLAFRLNLLRNCVREGVETCSYDNGTPRRGYNPGYSSSLTNSSIAGSHILSYRFPHREARCTIKSMRLARPCAKSPTCSSQPATPPTPGPASFANERQRPLNTSVEHIRLAHLETVLDEIHDVYHIDSCELEKRTDSAITLERIIRGFLIRVRRTRYFMALRKVKRRGAKRMIVVVMKGQVRCREVELGISRMLRRRRRKILYKHWQAITTTWTRPQISYVQRETSGANEQAKVKQAESCSPPVNSQGIPAESCGRRRTMRDAIGLDFSLIVSRALFAAQAASCSTERIISRCTRQVVRMRAIVARSRAIEDVLLLTIMRTWQRWAHIRVEGRVALVVAEPMDPSSSHAQDGSTFQARFLLQNSACPGLKDRFNAPHDIQAAARIAHCSKLRRYCGAWRSRSSLLKEVHLRRRRKLTQFARTQLKAWHSYAIKLQAARCMALDRWRLHLLVRLSRPLCAWYLWAHARIVQRKDTERVVSAFTRLKKRHVAAVTLRAWRHAAELNRLEARYTRRQLMGALAEQKGHVRRLERLAEDHDMTRAELDNAADLAHERAAKLARNALVRDDDCRYLESRLESAENDVALAQRVLSSIETDRSALTQHILRMQPVVGFANQGLSNLAHDRDARLGAGVSSTLGNAEGGDFMSSRTSTDMEGMQDPRGDESLSQNAGFMLANTIAGSNAYEDVSASHTSGAHIHLVGEADIHDDVIELPPGMALIRHPNETGGLMLCRKNANFHQAHQDGIVDGGPDVTKRAFAVRLDWLLAAVHSMPPLVDFSPLTQVAGAPLFKDASTTRSKESDRKKTESRSGGGDSEGKLDLPEGHSSFVPMHDVSLAKVESAAIELLKSVKDMYGIFEFLRDGNLAALPERLIPSWNASTTECTCTASSSTSAIETRSVQGADVWKERPMRPWKNLTLKARLSGMSFKWRDVHQHIGARLLRGRPYETKSDRMVKHIVESIDRVDFTCIALYSGATRHLRPNIYGFQALVGDSLSERDRLWDSVG